MPNEKEYDGEGCHQAVMEKEQTYRALVENIPQQIFIKGTDYVYQSCNENFANDLGLSQEDIVGMTDYDLFPGQFADAFRADDRRVIESGSTEIIEEPYESRGKKRWAHTVKTPLRDSQGKINGILGIYSDITEQKELHEALQNSEANLRSIFEAVTEPVFMLSTDGTVIDSNEEFASKLGKTRKDLINHCVYDYLPPDVAERSKAWVEKIISSGKPFITEDHRMGHDLEHSMYPIFDENKSVRNIAVFVRDVTEFKQIERALRDSEERWKFALEGARNGVWDWNIETGQLFESEQCRAINGFQSHEMTFNVEERLGKIHPEDIEEFTCSLRAHFHGETPFFENDHRSLAADGCYKWISARGKVMGWSDDGKPLRMLGTITDISKRKQMEVALRQAKENLEQTVNQRTAELMEANKRLARELEERCLAQLALQQSEERFRLLFEKSEAVLLLIDPDSGNILDANETASKYYGYSHKTICEMSIHEINCLPPEEVLAERQLAKTEKRNYFVFPHRLSSGEMRTVEVYSSPVKINGHTILFSIVHDITDRKNAEIALLEYADEILDLYDNAPCGYHSIDQAGFLIRINNTELNWLGYTRDQIIGKKRITDMMTAESLAKFHQSFPEFKNRGTIEGLEIDLIRENGTIMPVLINAIAIYDSEGAYVMSRSSLFDISQRKAAQNDLIESEQRFKSLAEASFEAIAISENGIVLDCNDNFSEISGYSHLELVGMNQMDLVVDEHKPNVWRIIKSESEEPYEAQWIKKDGSLITIAGRGKMASYKGRQVRVTSIRDITEIKKSEAESERLRKQLLASQKMEAIGTLAGGIAHDFNNLLFAMMGYADMAINEVHENSPTFQKLQHILGAGRRAADMVNQILYFSRRNNETKQPLSIGPILKEGLKFLRGSIPTTIEFHERIAHDAWQVLADPTQVYQVLMNLCLNAAPAMKDTAGSMTVELANVELDEEFTRRHPPLVPGKYVRLTVSDTGHGMPRNVLDRIFEPFFTTKEVGQGTGLGLSVVHGIVKNHHGIITVYSEPSMGATFNVFLPSIGEESESTREETPPEVQSGTESILLVDDEKIICEMVGEMLVNLGYQVTSTVSSRNALQLFLRNPQQFDLVLTDLTMPEMTGIQLAREVMRISPQTPVILATGYGQATEDPVKQYGFKAIVKKPVLRDELARVVRKALTKVPGSSE